MGWYGPFRLEVDILVHVCAFMYLVSYIEAMYIGGGARIINNILSHCLRLHTQRQKPIFEESFVQVPSRGPALYFSTWKSHYPSILKQPRAQLDIRPKWCKAATLVVKSDCIRSCVYLAVVRVTRGVGVGEGILACPVRAAVARGSSMEEPACELGLGDGGAEDEGGGEDGAVVGVVECGGDWAESSVGHEKN